jgi:hypothetical protein
MITVFKFLSGHGHLPAAQADVGVFTIVVNACLITATLLWMGGLIGFAFAALASRADRWWKTIGKAILTLAFALILVLIPGPEKYMRLLGVLMLVAVGCLLTPLGKVIEGNFIVSGVVVATLSILAVLLMPEWVSDWWASETRQPAFTIIPLSSMGFAEWGCAALGAVVYVAAYVLFQEFRTKGKWIDDLREKIHPKAE